MLTATLVAAFPLVYYLALVNTRTDGLNALIALLVVIVASPVSAIVLLVMLRVDQSGSPGGRRAGLIAAVAGLLVVPVMFIALLIILSAMSDMR